MMVRRLSLFMDLTVAQIVYKVMSRMKLTCCVFVFNRSNRLNGDKAVTCRSGAGHHQRGGRDDPSKVLLVIL